MPYLNAYKKIRKVMICSPMIFEMPHSVPIIVGGVIFNILNRELP